MSRQHKRAPRSTSLSAKTNGKGASPVLSFQASEPFPNPDDRAAWETHWAAQGQPWRTEPEIDQKRQKELETRRAIAPDIEKGIYPFKGMKLNRADMEWLLATHEHGCGPVYWHAGQPVERAGLDLRGADLSHANLENLPLACTIGGLRHWHEWQRATEEQRQAAAIHLENAQLRYAHLEKAWLRQAYLPAANLRYASLEGATLFQAHLEGASLYKARLEDTNLRQTHLEGANLCLTFLDRATTLDAAILMNKQYGPLSLLDVHWGETNLASVDWSQLTILGEEYQLQKGFIQGEHEEEAYREAVRANRQLAIALQSQGLNEDAARFAYRAQSLQRNVFWRQQSFGKWLFSWLLFLLAGYGYKPGRSFLTYFLVIVLFATAYYLIGHAVGPSLSPLGAFVFSMTSFHGRGFFPGNNISLDDPLTVLAALEALVGLIIEVTFIATLTQRFFNR